MAVDRGFAPLAAMRLLAPTDVRAEIQLAVSILGQSCGAGLSQ
jgi:hypothetical protein